MSECFIIMILSVIFYINLQLFVKLANSVKHDMRDKK